MNTLHLTHLTDDQIDDALIGDLAAECATHLAGCDACQQRLTAAEAPIAGFNAVSLAWSERRSATLPVPAAIPARASWLPRAAWAAMAAAALAVGIAVPLAHRNAGPASVANSAHPAPAASAPALVAVDTAPTLMASTGPLENPAAVRDEQIAHDNQMLKSIDREMAAPADATAQELGLAPARIEPAAELSN